MATLHQINSTEAPEVGGALADSDLVPLFQASSSATKRTLLSRIPTYILSAARTFTAALLSSSPTGGIGYATGAGGTVTQSTNLTTGVTLNTVTGTITTASASAAAGAEDGPFTVTNSAVAATDVVVVSIKSYGGAGTPQVYVSAVAAGSFAITVTNLHASNALNAAIVISFAVIKGVAS